MGKTMMVKIKNITAKDLQSVRQTNLKKLQEFKSKGYSKERLYKIFSKQFVDKNYGL